jgi:amino acid transporter
MSTQRGAPVATAAPAVATSTGLWPNAVGLTGVLFQSVTLMGPGVAVAFAYGPGISYAGGSFPLALLLAMVGCLLLAISFGQLAIHLPSAGGYYTYISRGLGRSTGFLAGWIGIPAYLLFLPLNLIAAGFALQSASGGSLPWWMAGIAIAVLMALLTFFGVRLSLRTLVVLGAIEIGVILLLSGFLIATANDNTLQAFTPATWAHGRGGVTGVLVGTVIGFLVFTGFESAAMLAEESRHPRRIVPRALILSVVLIGLFFVVAAYAGLAGYGFDHIGTTRQAGTYLGDSPTPWFTLGQRAWGSIGKDIIQLVVLESLLANVAAGYTALSRIVFAMGRSGALPSMFGRANRRFRTPTLAIFLGALVTIGVALWEASVYGAPPNSFFLLVDTAAYFVLLAYIGVSLAVPFYYLRERRAEFSVLRHAIIPVVTVALLVIVLASQFLFALPPDHYPGLLPQYLGTIIAGGWLILGIVRLLVLRARNPKALEAGERIYVESPE